MTRTDQPAEQGQPYAGHALDNHPNPYLAVLHLLRQLTQPELNTLRTVDIPREQQHRRGVVISAAPVGSNAINSVRG